MYVENYSIDILKAYWGSQSQQPCWVAFGYLEMRQD